MSNYEKYKKENEDAKFPSELRYDLISKDWVVVATGRAKRPETFKKERRKKEGKPPKDCPFCNIETQKKPALVFANGKEVTTGEIPDNWSVVSIPNLYPAFYPGDSLDKEIKGGLYQRMNAVGFHEVVVTRDHKKQMAQFSQEKLKEVVDVYQKRYLDLIEREFVNYVFIFHNHGEEAGASIAHPHSQIITTPLLDSDLNKALSNSKEYLENKKECVYCRANKWELEEGERIVFENEKFVVLCPFASKAAFQVIVSPKKHSPYFEKITEEEKEYLAEALRQALGRLYVGLDDPPYNFYIHSAPCDDGKHDYYHWHFTIIPKTATWAGFELGAQMEISTIEPEVAAEHLRKQKV